MIEKSRLPLVTLILIIANLVAAFALAVDPDLAMVLGFKSKDPSGLTFITNLFLHQNLLHLLGNMVFLAAVGAAVELATGSTRFLIVYLFSGLLGTLAHMLFTMGQPESATLIGASGAIAGCAGYYSVRYIGLKVPIAPHIGISVWKVTLVWLILQLVGAFVRIGEQAAVSFWAHIGGFVGGLILSALFRAPDLGQRRLGHEVLDAMNERGPAAAALAARQHLKSHPGDVRALRDLIEAERQLGHAPAEFEAIQQLVSVLPDAEQSEPLERLGELGKLETIPSVRRTVLADKLGESNPNTSRMLLQSILDGPIGDPQIPEAMLALASLERESEPEKAKGILTELEARYPLHPAVDLARKRGWIS